MDKEKEGEAEAPQVQADGSIIANIHTCPTCGLKFRARWESIDAKSGWTDISFRCTAGHEWGVKLSGPVDGI